MRAARAPVGASALALDETRRCRLLVGVEVQVVERPARHVAHYVVALVLAGRAGALARVTLTDERAGQHIATHLVAVRGDQLTYLRGAFDFDDEIDLVVGATLLDAPADTGAAFAWIVPLDRWRWRRRPVRPTAGVAGDES